MWSGPRNISTAMMRAFENRDDTAVVDEPFYAFYLDRTRVDHPGFDEALASQPTDWRKVVEQLLGPAPGDAPVFYQKHHTHHLLPEVDRGWMARLTHVFLIRHPAEVVSSYVKRRSSFTLEDIGFIQQEEIHRDLTARLGSPPLVLDAKDVLTDPRRMLTKLCSAVGIPFSEKMLSWPPGLRSTDGVWAKHWYANVVASTGFHPYRPSPPSYPETLRSIVDAALPSYERLHAMRLR